MILTEEIVTTDSSAGLNDGVRYKRSKFANATVFDVDFNLVMRPELQKHPRHRYKRYFIDENLSNEIRNYSKENPKEDIILRCSKSGRMCYFKRNGGG